jgi:hypothetical protein
MRKTVTVQKELTKEQIRTILYKFGFVIVDESKQAFFVAYCNEDLYDNLVPYDIELDQLARFVYSIVSGYWIKEGKKAQLEEIKKVLGL